MYPAADFGTLFSWDDLPDEMWLIDYYYGTEVLCTKTQDFRPYYGDQYYFGQISGVELYFGYSPNFKDYLGQRWWYYRSGDEIDPYFDCFVPQDSPINAVIRDNFADSYVFSNDYGSWTLTRVADCKWEYSDGDYYVALNLSEFYRPWFNINDPPPQREYGWWVNFGEGAGYKTGYRNTPVGSYQNSYGAYGAIS